MKSLRDKIFLIYLVFTIGILALAGFSYISSQQLTERIETLTVPNKKSGYIKEISTNITKFTNLYLESPNTLLFSKEHDRILEEIQVTLQLLRNEYSPEDPETLETLESLDSIPEILENIKLAHSEIRYLNRQYQDDFYSRVEEEILKKITINDLKDAGYVEEKVRSEIVKIIEKDTAIKEAQKQKPEEQSGILTGIFTQESKKEEPPKVNVEEKVNKAKKEALLSSDIDNLFFSKKVEYIKNEVNKVLYQEQIKAIKVRSKEKQIFNSNVALINKLEAIFQKIQREEDKKLRETTISTYNASKRFNKILIVIILGFGISSLAILFFLFKDIERNKYYQSLLRKSEKKATKKAMEKQKFLSMMSHELRTPLTSLIGYTDLLEPNSRYKNPIQSSAHYLWKVANEIFDLAKMEEGKIEINTDIVSLKNIMNDLNEKFSDIITKAGIEFRILIPEKDDLVLVDPFRLKQVLYNIVQNAIKFTKAGSISIEVTILPQPESNDDSLKNTIRFTIEDTGIGIDDSDHEKIFKEFTQSGTDYDKKKGMGIGLGLSRKIMEAMGGRILLQSTKGKGSIFSVEFESDVIPPEDEQTRQAVDMSESKISERILADYRILTLEDDPMISKLYSDILSGYGAIVISESNHEQVFDRLKKGEIFDVFVTDIKMPNINGIDFLELLDKEGIKPRHCIGVTANIFFEEEYKERINILSTVLYKPFTKEELIQSIARVEPQSKSNRLKDYNPITHENKPPIQSQPIDELVDLSFFKMLSMNDEELFRENVFLFLQENHRDLNLLNKNLNDENWKISSELVHRLSGRFAQVLAKTESNPLTIEKLLLSMNQHENSETRMDRNIHEEKDILVSTRLLIDEWENIIRELESRFPWNLKSSIPEELRI